MDDPRPLPIPRGPALAGGALGPGRVGLFGGSFDPVHGGHLTVIRAVLERGLVEHLVVVPARVSPHKLDAPPTPAAARLDLLEVALGSLEPALRARLSIWTAELERDGPSFTLDTVRALVEARGPGAARPRLVIGQDSVVGLPRWRSIDGLIAAVDLVVVERGGSRPLEALLAALGEGAPTDLVAAVRGGWLPLDRPSPTSSTALRGALADGGERADAELPPEVLRRIRARGLYGPGGPRERDE